MMHLPDSRWNMFARILDDILDEHDIPLSDLIHAGVHREKVRRLRKSLVRPLNFPMLNPDEMELVIGYYHFTTEDILRMRAAIVATAVERILFDRIPANDALKATEEVYPNILAAIRVMKTAVREGDPPMSTDQFSQDELFDGDLQTALDAVDSAILALHLSRSSEHRQEQLRHAQEAQLSFQIALAEFERWKDRLGMHETWQLWYDEATNGANAAMQRMKELAL